MKSKTQQFIDKANEVHNYLYTYLNCVYNKGRDKVLITCLKHGDFLQTASNHLTGKTCLKCTREKHKPKHTLNLEKFINKSNKVHNFKYNYSKSIFINTRTNIDIICPIHGLFNQLANNHLQGSECEKCSYGSVYSKTKWINMCNKKKTEPLVYIIRCFNDNENFIKIGKTSFTVKSRFTNGILPYSYEILKEIKGSPDFIFDEEIRLHRLYKNYSILPLLKFGGRTEYFSIEILKLFNH